MTDTANLALPCIEGSQAQKHVTHNDALRILDTLVQLAVLDRDLTAPPGSPAEGQRWIVKTGATGAWAGHANAIAAWQDGVWQFSTPQLGGVAVVGDEATLVVWSGGAWGEYFSTVAIQNLSMLGVGTTADTTNRVSAKLNNALWTAKTVAEGGDGNLRYKMSKESAAKTLSLLLQDNYSGRAEIGLTGDDDLHLKVSPDGTTWYEGIKIAAATGAVTFPNTTIAAGREILTGNRTYYVRTDGSNSNNGLANTSSGAWLTLQKAMDVVAGSIDLAGFNVTVNVADGTYTGALAIKPWLGGGTVSFIGNTVTPANCIISTTSADAINHSLGALPGKVTIKGFKLRTTTSGYGMNFIQAGAFDVQNMDFGAVASAHMLVKLGALINFIGNYTITGSAAYHMIVGPAGQIVALSGVAVTLTGTPAFGGYFAYVTNAGSIYAAGFSYSGSATGTRYLAEKNGVFDGTGAVATFFPGNSAGSVTTGGQYT
jgi:hypothetical protein